MKRILLDVSLLLAGTVTSFAQYQNIQVGTLNFPNEPAIMWNPGNINEMVAGANIASFYYSSDTGLTWTTGTLSSSWGVWGDPCIASDNIGTFYYFHLNNNQVGTTFDRIVCQRSFDGGVTWDDGTAFGLDGTKWQEKPWAVHDPGSGNLYVTWTQDDVFASSNPLDSSIIRFCRSADGGATWSTPVRLNRIAGNCALNGYGVNGPMPALGVNGEVLVTWVGPVGLMFKKSTDQGLTWPPTDITVATLPVGWGCFIPGIYRAPGFPVIGCDRSNGPYRGTYYISWWDQRNGQDDADIWLSKSTDGGNTWSAPVRVNDDPPGNQQFFSWMAIDQVTGFLYFVFYDRRQYSDLNTDVFMAVSTDGGQSFLNFRVSESPFAPNASIFIGDYNNIIAHNNVVRPVWTRMENDILSIWTAKVDSIDLSSPPDPGPYAPFVLKQNYPNPVRSFTNFAYSVHEPSRVTLKIYDLCGREAAVVFEDKPHTPGQYVVRYPVDKNLIPPGFYFYTFTFRNKTLTRKMIIE